VADEPLAGRRLVVTRPGARGAALAAELGRLGASVLTLPLIRIEAVEDGPFAAALAEASGYDWVVFTSANAVEAAGRLSADLSRTKVAAVGPATAAALRRLGTESAFVPDRFAAQHVVPGLEPLVGARVLLPQADVDDGGLADAVRERGATVTVITAYRTVPVERSASELAELRAADAVVLASGSAARSLASQGGPGEALVVCIGPRTAEAAGAVGLPVGLVADEATAKGIIHALTEHFGETMRR
jgi:uroporphyrinogen-III synthase